MKRLLLLAALLACGNGVIAAGRASEIIDKLASGFRSMGAYSVSFDVASNDFATHGNYAVDGERYYMTLGDAEVFCDGKTRWEVDNRRREVTLSGVDAQSRNILNNPVHAFDFLGSEYTPSLAWEKEGRAAVTLTPVSMSAAATGTITVTVSTASMRPLSLAYEYDGGGVGITVGGVAPLKTPLKTFDKKNYTGYEFIDFR